MARSSFGQSLKDKRLSLHICLLKNFRMHSKSIFILLFFHFEGGTGAFRNLLFGDTLYGAGATFGKENIVGMAS